MPGQDAKATAAFRGALGVVLWSGKRATSTLAPSLLRQELRHRLTLRQKDPSAYDQAMRLLAVIVFLVAALPQPLAAQVYEAAVTANKRGDYLTAIKYLRPLAEKGVPEAQALLGAMYAQGRGVPPDPAKAIKWFRKGIEQGNHWAQHNLGFMYAQGHGVPKITSKPRSGSAELPIKVTPMRRAISALCIPLEEVCHKILYRPIFGSASL